MARDAMTHIQDPMTKQSDASDYDDVTHDGIESEPFEGPTARRMTAEECRDAQRRVYESSM